MDLKFTSWIDIKVAHDYYQTGQCHDFDFAPEDEVLSLMRNNLLSTRVHNGGLSIFKGGTSSEPTYFSGDDMADTRLVFDMHVNNPLFSSFTDLRTHDRTHIYYLSNCAARAEGQLTSQSDGVMSDGDLLPLRPMSFMLDLEPGFDTNLTLKRLNGEELPAPEPLMHEDGSALLIINLTGYGSGGYALTTGGNTTTFYARPDSVAAAPMAVMELFCQGAVEGSDIFEDGQPVQRTFQLGFHARAVRWSYYIIPRSFSPKEVTMKVSSDENDADFEGPENTTDPQQQEAVLFRSKSAIELREKPENIFSLTVNPSNGRNGMKNLSVDLPVPMLTSIGLEKVDGDQPFANSNMYVYL